VLAEGLLNHFSLDGRSVWLEKICPIVPPLHSTQVSAEKALKQTGTRRYRDRHKGGPENMANKVANVDDVTDAISGVTLADRAPRTRRRIPALHNMPTNQLRSHLHRLPEEASVVAESAVRDDLLSDAADATGFAAVGRAAVGAGAITAMAANAFDGRLFVANFADDSVSVLDGYTLAVVSTIAGTPEPYGLAIARGRTYVSTVAGSHDAVTVTDAESVLDTHALADTVQDIVVDREGRQVYVARTGRDGADIAVIDTATGAVSTVDLDSRAGEVANALTISGDGRRLILATTDQLGGRLVVVDISSLRVMDTLTVAEPVRGLAASHDGNSAWVATDGDTAGGLVDLVDLRSRRVLGTVDVGGPVRQLMLSAVGDRVYVVTAEAVLVIDTGICQVADTIDIGSEPSCVTESADGSRFYVADFDGRVALFSVASTTPSLLARISTPEALAGPSVRELERVGV
jgi:YVTN family beta-propeller protein